MSLINKEKNTAPKISPSKRRNSFADTNGSAFYSAMSDLSLNRTALTLRSVTKCYDRRPVLSDLSMELSAGTFYCLMAPSGSGKTTLFRLILGLEKPDSGTILFHPSTGTSSEPESNSSSGTASKPDFRSLRGSRPPIPAVFQENRLLECYTAIENLRFALGKQYSNEELNAYLLRLLPEDSLNKPVCEFSGGMKRRVSILRAILAPSEIILMDEPFTGLDTDTKQLTIDLIKELCAGKLLIIATHVEDDAELLGAKIIHL